MKKVAIPVFRHVVPSCAVGPYDILEKTSQMMQMKQGSDTPFFDISMIDLTDGKENGWLPVKKGNLDFSEVYDLVLVPAMQPESVDQVLENEKELISWIRYQYQHGAEVASICYGAFILAETGLLDEKRATTHWMGAEAFRQRYPSVLLEDDKIIVDEGNIYSCGGAYSFTSFMMYLLEKYYGREVSLASSRLFLVDMNKDPQQSFSIFSLQKDHGIEPILRVQEYIEESPAQKHNVDDLAELAQMSRRTFIRKFKSATGNTPLEYVQRVRVEKAKKQIEKDSLSIEEISMDCGYEDYPTFRTLFKRYTGISPADYRKKYRRIIPSL